MSGWENINKKDHLYTKEEKLRALKVLEQNNFNQAKTAKDLGISRHTLRRWREKYQTDSFQVTERAIKKKIEKYRRKYRDVPAKKRPPAPQTEESADAELSGKAIYDADSITELIGLSSDHISDLEESFITKLYVIRDRAIRICEENMGKIKSPVTSMQLASMVNDMIANHANKNDAQAESFLTQISKAVIKGGTTVTEDTQHEEINE